MKHFVTAFLLLTGVLAMNSELFAQAVSPTGRQAEVHQTHSVALMPNSSQGDPSTSIFYQNTKSKLGALSGKVDSLQYFDSLDGLFNWYWMPSHITLSLQSPTRDTLDLIVGYAERFTSKYTTTYLDSVVFVVAPLMFDDQNGVNNRIVSEARKVLSRKNMDGTTSLFVDYTTLREDSVQLHPSELIADSIPRAISLHFHHKRMVGNTFCVTLNIVDTERTLIAVRGDSTQVSGGRAIDNTVDRAYFITNMYQNYMAGLSYGMGDPFYPNLVMIAYVTDTSKVGVSTGKPVSSFDLAQNYPNPFNPSTEISYSLPEQAKVTLKVTNALGQEIATLVNRSENAGSHTVRFDANNLPSGTYFYTLQAGSFTQSRHMILSK